MQRQDFQGFWENDSYPKRLLVEMSANVHDPTTAVFCLLYQQG